MNLFLQWTIRLSGTAPHHQLTIHPHNCQVTMSGTMVSDPPVPPPSTSTEKWGLSEQFQWGQWTCSYRKHREQKWSTSDWCGWYCSLEKILWTWSLTSGWTKFQTNRDIVEWQDWEGTHPPQKFVLDRVPYVWWFSLIQVYPISVTNASHIVVTCSYIISH